MRVQEPVSDKGKVNGKATGKLALSMSKGLEKGKHQKVQQYIPLDGSLCRYEAGRVDVGCWIDLSIGRSECG